MPALSIRCRLLSARILAPLLGASLLALGLAPSDTRRDAEWIQWRDARIKWILTPSTQHDGTQCLDQAQVAARCRRALGEYDAMLQGQSTDSPVGLENFLAFVRSQALMETVDSVGRQTHRLGFSLSDKEYARLAEPFVRLPDLIVNQSFLRDMSDPAGYRSAVRQIEAQAGSEERTVRWRVLLFRGRFIKSVDRTTYGRMLVVIPGRTGVDGALYDQWIQFALATPDQPQGVDERSVSVVSVVRREHKARPEVYFMDYLRTTDPLTGDIRLVPTAVLDDNPSKNCYDCHKTGVLPIRPDLMFDFDIRGRLTKASDTSPTLRVLDELAAAYGRPDIVGMDEPAYGPSVGSSDVLPDRSFVKSVSAPLNLSDESLDRIRQAMACCRCHDSIGPLNFPAGVRRSRDETTFKYGRSLTQTYVEEGWMPPGNQLSRIERVELWQCLSRQYLDLKRGTGTFVDWLQGR